MPEPTRRARHRDAVERPSLFRAPAVRRTARAVLLAGVVAGTASFAGAEVPSESTVLGAAESAGAEAFDRSGLAASRFEARTALAPLRDVRVVVDGESHGLSTRAERVHEVLTEAGIVVDADDQASTSLNAHVRDGMTVTITRVDADAVTETTTDAHGTVEQEDPNLPVGERAVVTEGVDGVQRVTYQVHVAGGEEVRREVLARVVVSTRVDEVVAIGTAEPPEPVEVAPEPEPAEAGAEPEADADAGAAEEAPVATYEGDTRALGAEMAAARGWGGGQFQCLEELWTRESNWNPTAMNPSSGAYGIPQSLPGSKMASVGADWRTNPVTQITWGLNYIAGRYGTPCAALAHSHSVGWY